MFVSDELTSFSLDVKLGVYCVVSTVEKAAVDSKHT